MKTTIDIPEALYKKAEIRAIETGRTLKQIVLTSLEKELMPAIAGSEPEPFTWTHRALKPEFVRFEQAGAYAPRPSDRDITDLISDDREGR